MEAASKNCRLPLAPIQTLTEIGIVLENGDGIAEANLGLAAGLAAVGHLELHQGLAARPQSCRELAQVARPLGAGASSPSWIGARGRRSSHVRRIGRSDFGEGQAARESNDLQSRAPAAFLPFAICKHTAVPLDQTFKAHYAPLSLQGAWIGSDGPRVHHQELQYFGNDFFRGERYAVHQANYKIALPISSLKKSSTESHSIGANCTNSVPTFASIQIDVLLRNFGILPERRSQQSAGIEDAEPSEETATRHMRGRETCKKLMPMANGSSSAWRST